MGKTILMVDDEPDILKIVKIRLVKQGHDVIFAANGQEGVDMAKTKKPDLIIMDYRMPVLNGLEATKKIKNDPDIKNIPILFMSASSASLNELDLKKAGIADFLGKPFEADELLKKITSYLN